MGKLNLARPLWPASLALSCAVLTACGGGSGADASSSSQGTTTTVGSSQLSLTNLPDKKTTSVSASIGYELSGAGASYTVYCRLDSYAPVVCPASFQLGQTTGLSAGTHTVDYYVDTGSGIDVNNPTSSYTWTVAATTSTATGSTGTATTVASTAASTSTATPLPSLPMPATTIVSGGTSSSSWTGLTNILDSGGTTLLGPVTDPNGSGRTVNLSRLLKNSSLLYGGVRAEQGWPSTGLQVGHDYWMAFAVMLKPGEAVGSGDDTMLVFQTHTPAQGATTPDISLNLTGSRQQMFWAIAYNSQPSNTWNYVGGPNPDTEKEVDLTPTALFPAGQWYRVVLHYRPGYTTASAPMFEVWASLNGAAYTKTVTYSGLNTYNSLVGPSYPRIGPYKWSDSAWGSSSEAFYQTPLYFGEGTDLFDAARASLNGF